MKVIRIFTAVAMSLALIPWNEARVGDGLHRPTPAQKKLCRQEIEDFRVLGVRHKNRRLGRRASKR